MTTESGPASASPAPRAGRRWAGLPQAANYSCLSESTLRRMAEGGHIRLYKPSPRRVLVDLDEIDAALALAPAAGPPA